MTSSRLLLKGSQWVGGDLDLRCLLSAKMTVQGLLLRHNAVHNAHVGAHWTTSLLFSLIQELVDCYDSSKDNFNGTCDLRLTTVRNTDKRLVAVDDAARVIETYNRFAERIDELGLQGDVDAKPILDVSPVIVMHYQRTLMTCVGFISFRRGARSCKSSARLNRANGLAKSLLR